MGKQFTTMRDLIRGFTGAINLISPEVENHHEKVAYLSTHLAHELGMNEQEQRLVFYGALFHDIGSIMAEGNISLHDLESKPFELARSGASILKMFEPTSFLSSVVEESQSPWEAICSLPDKLRKPRLIGQVIHLADAITLLLREDESVLNQIPVIKKCIHESGQKEFHPDVLKAFDAMCERDAVWLDVLYRPDLFLDFIPVNRAVSLDETVRLAEFMSAIIDFRSPFTAMHSAGVASAAVCLAGLSGMSEDECKMMKIAGSLHDVGKLKIPTSILEKPGKLTDYEFNIMKEHAYYTYILLKDIRGFEQITEWAALHHEKLHGNGYPFHLSENSIPLGSRIMAVADVFSAVTEDRPYRKGMDKESAVSVLLGDAERGALSNTIVGLLLDHYDEINEQRAIASRAASKRYQESLAQNVTQPQELN